MKIKKIIFFFVFLPFLIYSRDPPNKTKYSINDKRFAIKADCAWLLALRPTLSAEMFFGKRLSAEVGGSYLPIARGVYTKETGHPDYNFLPPIPLIIFISSPVMVTDFLVM